MKFNRLKATALAAALGLGAVQAQAGVLANPEPDAELIPGQYIVELNGAGGLVGDVVQIAQEIVGGVGGGELLHVYESALQGFAVELTPLQALLVSLNPLVKHVEQDQVIRAIATQQNATWGIDRSDERARQLDGRYTYPDSGAQGVHVYVIDTGVNPNHSDFTGRMGQGRNFVSSGGFLFGGGSVDPNDWEDCNGHGTHVASTAAGTVYGIAKQATVHAVRVLGCNGSGSNSGVIDGVDWVAANAPAGSVANMSLGGGNSTALDNAVNNAINNGITMVVAAGNDNSNACNGSPNRVSAAITVGSTTSSDNKSSFSNFGTCLDIWAPGSSITAATHSNNTGTRVLSGTSMAAPHVAGAVALILGREGNPSPAQVRNTLVNEATVGALTGSLGSGSPNRLMYVSNEGGVTPPVDTNPPTAAFSFDCDDLVCSFDGSASSDAEGEIASYSWDFNSDGNEDATGETVPSVSFAEGSYLVTLTVTDGANLTDTETQTVEVTAPDTGSPCSDCNVATGNIGSGQTAYSPSSNGFSSNGGVFEGYLRGPAGANMDLYLERFSPGFLFFRGSWNVVAASESANADEDINYSGGSGTYRWRITSRSGGGNVEFYFKNP